MRYSLPLAITGSPSIIVRSIGVTWKNYTRLLTIIPPPWVLCGAFAELSIVEFEIMVSSRCFPESVVFVIVEWRRYIQETFESNQIPQRRHGIIQHHVHPTSVHGVDAFPPYVDRGEVRVEECQVQRAESIRTPGKVDHGTTGEVDTFDPHTRQVVQCVHKSLYITSVSQLCSCQVVFPSCAVNVVVTWVAVYEPVEHDSIEWKAPVVWRWVKC